MEPRLFKDVPGARLREPACAGARPAWCAAIGPSRARPACATALVEREGEKGRAVCNKSKSSLIELCVCVYDLAHVCVLLCTRCPHAVHLKSNVWNSCDSQPVRVPGGCCVARCGSKQLHSLTCTPSHAGALSCSMTKRSTFVVCGQRVDSVTSSMLYYTVTASL